MIGCKIANQIKVGGFKCQRGRHGEGRLGGTQARPELPVVVNMIKPEIAYFVGNNVLDIEEPQ